MDNLRSLFREHARATERQFENILESLDYIEYKLEHLGYYYDPTGYQPDTSKTRRNALELSDDKKVEDVMETDEE